MSRLRKWISMHMILLDQLNEILFFPRLLINKKWKNRFMDYYKSNWWSLVNLIFICSTFLLSNHSEQKKWNPQIVVNYKPIKNITISFNYPLPHKEIIMQQIQSAKHFFPNLIVKVDTRYAFLIGTKQLLIHLMDFISGKWFQLVWRMLPHISKDEWILSSKNIHSLLHILMAWSYLLSLYLSMSQNLIIFFEVVKEHGFFLLKEKMDIGVQDVEFIVLIINDGKLIMQPHIIEKIV